MSSLSQRLAQLRKAGGSLPVSRRSGLTAEKSRIPPGEGWELIAGGAWERTIHYPVMLPDSFNDPFVLPEEISGTELTFYDLETTGLSGGAGNIAFLIGLGRQRGGSFVVTQLFLEDYPGEPALMKRYSELIQDNHPQVSYNGRSFDSQVLKTRFLLNRMSPLIPPQIDLLYPSRRLWKGKLPNLSLGTLEKDVLSFFREDDLPGREAPDAWFEWLEGDDRRIAGVFRHNADDILSLARLLVRLEEWGKTEPDSLEGGQKNYPEGISPSGRGMARQWLIKNPSQELRWLKAGWRAGESLCGRELSLRLKRAGKYKDAAAIWIKLNRGKGDYFSAVELAKYYEHRLKDPESAFDVLRGQNRLLSSPVIHEKLEYRRRRLVRKIEERRRLK